MNAVVALWWNWILFASIHFLLILPAAWCMTKLFPAHRYFSIHRIIWQCLALSLILPRIVPFFEANSSVQAGDQIPSTHPMTLYFWIWITVVSFLAAWTAFAYQLQRQTILKKTKESHDLMFQLNQLASRLEVKLPSVRWQKDGSPFTFGLFKPILVLPIDFFELGQDSQQHMLLHEITHLRHFDNWRALFCGVIRHCFFFHPGVWWLSKKLETLREMACDRKVIERIGDPIPYCKTLLQTALGPTQIQSGHAFFRRKGQLRQRMEVLKQFEPQSRSPLFVFFILIIWTFVCMPYGPDQRHILDFQAPPLAELEGCMQKKYAVMLAIAQQKENP